MAGSASSSSGQLCRALYDYGLDAASLASAPPEALGIHAGDVLRVVSRDDAAGWWSGFVVRRASGGFVSEEGPTGLFPAAYAVLLTPSETLEFQQAWAAASASKTATTTKPPPPPPPPSAPSRRGRGIRVKMLWEYAPQAPDELHVYAGEELDVMQSPDPEWWQATSSRGDFGIFPKNYSEVLVEASAADAALPPRPTRSSTQANASTVQAPSFASLGSTTASASTSATLGALSASAPATASGAFSLGGDRPVWQHASFAGAVADREVSYEVTKLTGATLRQEFDGLVHSINFSLAILERMAARLGDALGARAVARGVAHAQWLAQNLPVHPGPTRGGRTQQQVVTGEKLPEGDLEAGPGDPAERFTQFLQSWCQRVRELRPGDVMLVPTGWSNAETPRPPLHGASKADAGFKRGFVFLVISPSGGTSTTSETCDVSVCNDGCLESDPDTLQYHPPGMCPTTGKPKRAAFLTFERVPRTKLNDSSFWYLCFRALVYNHAINTPDTLYQVLLPYLNQVPLRTAMKQPLVFKSALPRPGDALSRFHLVKIALRCAWTHHSGKATPSERSVKSAMVEFKREIAAMTLNDVQLSPIGLASAESQLARLAGKQLAESASKLEYIDASPNLDDRALLTIRDEVTKLYQAVEAKSTSSTTSMLTESELQDCVLTGVSRSSPAPWGGAFPFFGRFRRDVKTLDHLAGTRTIPPILRPVQLTLVPERVSSFHDVAVALRHCANVCTLLDNQKDAIKNTYCLRVALIQHLFTHVVPLPAPHGFKESCFWASSQRPMRYETQADLLRLLEVVGRHFTSAALSLKVTRSFDAVRIVTAACIATVADAVARKIAYDVPSQFSLHLSGEAEGPVQPFGFEMGFFLEESGFLEFADPYSAAARTQILDYFHAQRAIVSEDHLLFRFERTMEFGGGDAALIDQLCVQMGFPRAGQLGLGAAAYLSGEDPVVVDNYPELGLYRDICFLFKSLMTPTSSSLPVLKAWRATDARLTWRVKRVRVKQANEKAGDAAKPDHDMEDYEPLAPGEDPHANRLFLLQVAGFGQKELKCAAFSRHYVSKDLVQTGAKGYVQSFLGLFGLASDERPRAPPSGANPSNLVKEPIVTEDDVLHVRNLPTFQQRLGARDCELLLTYLTAPYVRIPLIMQFFAEQSRVSCLASPEIQAVLDASLFEPSLFQASDAEPPTTVPVMKRESLATPAGLLFNELQRSPHVLLRALDDMIFYALELDVGKYSTNSSAVLLYVVRMTVRVLSYIDFICENAKFLGLKGVLATGGASQRVRGVGGPDELPLPVLAVLEQARARLRASLLGPCFSTMEAWCEGAIKDKQPQLACVLYAHLAMVFQSPVNPSQPEAEMDYKAAAVTLCAYVFLTVNFRFTVAAETGTPEAETTKKEASAAASAPASAEDFSGIAAEELLRRLGVPQIELFFFFQQQRHKLMRFFERRPEDRDEVLEAVVRVVTMTGSHRKPAPGSSATQLARRKWQTMERPHCAGRFIPDTEVAAFRAAVEKLDGIQNFEEWLRRVTTLAVDTEVNVQLGEFTLKKNPMQLLPTAFFGFPDFQHLLGVYDVVRGDSLQCAEVANTKNRQWWRLVGKRMDVQLWVPDARPVTLASTPYKRGYPYGLTSAEKWISDVLEPYRSALLPGVELYMPTTSFDQLHFCRLAGLIAPSPDATPMTVESSEASKATSSGGGFFGFGKSSKDAGAGTSGAAGATVPNPSTMVEVVVFKDPPAVHVYVVNEHGRRFYSTLVFCSDQSFTFANFPKETSRRVDWTPYGMKLSAGIVQAHATPPEPTLVITRNLSAETGVQQYVPSRFLFGLIPQALLDRYDFWQNEADEAMMGYPKVPAHGPSLELSRPATAATAESGQQEEDDSLIRVELFKDKSVDESGMGTSMAYALVTKRSSKNPAAPVLTLLNPLYAPPGGPLRAVCRFFSRLDNPSHVLAWTTSTTVLRPNDAATIDVVELPRVKLTFRARVVQGSDVFACDEHTGLFVPTSSLLSLGGNEGLHLLAGVPSCVVLVNEDGDLHALLPANMRPSRPAAPNASTSLPTDLLLDRAHGGWIANLGNDVRHYLYPIHASKTFLFTPTLSSALYLLLCKFATRRFADVFKLADACVTDTPLTSEEAQVLKHLGSFNGDKSPDAHAVRLKITLVTMGSRESMPLPWSPAEEYAAYCQKFTRVSASCRLTLAEERFLNEFGETGTVSLDNRSTFLDAMRSGGKLIRPFTSPALLTGFPQFDATKDESALENRKSAASWTQVMRKLAKAKPMTYNRPPGTGDVVGAYALRIMERGLRTGVTIRGADGGLGFLFLYELMTGTLPIRVLPNDSCYNWACVLLRMMRPKTYQKHQIMTSLLRVLTYNPRLAAQLPKYEDTRTHKLSVMFRGQNDIEKLLESANTFLMKHATEVQWPQYTPEKPETYFAQESQKVIASLQNAGKGPGIDDPRRMRLFGLNFRVADFSLSSRPFTASKEFSHRPLGELCAQYVSERNRRERALPALAIPNTDVKLHPSAQSGPARAVLERLARDGEYYVQERTETKEPEMAPGTDLRGLESALTRVIREDRAAVSAGVSRVMEMCAKATPSHALRQLSGSEPRVGFDLLCATGMSESGDFDLSRFVPSLTKAEILAMREEVANVMFKSNRVHQAFRALRALHALTKLMSTPGTSQAGRDLASEGLARELAAKRFYVTNQQLDPRFLTFEFTFGIILRQSQVELVRDFSASVQAARERQQRGDPDEGATAKVHQMIMGAGKTTVVGPLLALLLADGKSLVMQCVPPALLEFSRSVMRECFSSAFLQKPVYTFKFERQTPMNRALLDKLRLARRARAIVCSTPTAIKSFFLKLVESWHILDNSRVASKHMESDWDEGQGLRGVLSRNVFGFSRLKKKRALDEAERALLRQQVEVGLEICAMMRDGALLLDEVDLILHPLKSELNWPIGVRLPLDFTYAPSRGVHGLRWHVPFHLLDALYVASGACAGPAFTPDDSREAKSLLEKLRVAVHEGCERRLLQRVPHLVLLSRAYYNGKLKPLLARWMGLFLFSKGVRGVPDDVLANYLSYGPRRASPDAVKAVRESLSDDNVKLLNLSHDWLDTFAPFCISRIDRVKFGLLSEEQKAVKGTPKNRKLLAVPFVGKDVPSHASEFSHPDILIGLTTLAYRYEGLRRSDFVVLLRFLRDRIDDEHGPYPKRPTGMLFVQWVEAAGGSVRGTRTEERRLKQAQRSSTAGEVLVETEHPTSGGAGPQGSEDLWPLQLVDVNEPVQVDVLYALLGKLPQCVLYYLDTLALPETMQHQGLKISACGQELGGTMLFKRRLGFSGTPSDLLPVELGTCAYEKGSDGQMLVVLSDPNVVSVRRTGPDWSVTALLEDLCAVDPATGRPLYDALIDTGALITGLSNRQVADFLLRRLPEKFVDGVVFLDQEDRKIILVRESIGGGGGAASSTAERTTEKFRALPLERAGIEIARRFTFYDQIHTTGMDVKQRPDAHAAVTMGKDMVFRDLAQGAYRMRGIGKGQTVEYVVVPEVDMLIEVSVAAGRGKDLTGADLDAMLQRHRMMRPGRVDKVSPQYLADVVAWLVINTCTTEKVQFNLLLEQSLSNVWRKRAFKVLSTPTLQMAADGTPGELVDVFRERIDYRVENTIPRQKTFVGKLEQAARERLSLLKDELDRGAVESLLDQARRSDSATVGAPAAKISLAGVEGDGSPEDVAKERSFNAEQVQEQEQEQEQQVEQEQEKEEERMEEDEQEEFVKKKYGRDDEAPQPWRAQDLVLGPTEVPTPSDPTNATVHPNLPFNLVSQFAVHKKIIGSIKPIAFPNSMRMSRNMYDPKWTLATFRRLKNVIFIMEYARDGQDALKPAARADSMHLDPVTLRPKRDLDSSRMGYVQRAFQMFDAGGGGQLDGSIATEIVRAMDVDVDKADVEFLQRCFQNADADKSSTLSFEEFKRFIDRRAFYSMQTQGRCYVALSLQEAESLRAILHSEALTSMFDRGFVALHSLATRTVFDATRRYVPASEYQDETFAQLFRFLDSEVQYDDRDTSILVRALQENAPEARKQWFEDVGECRRRPRRVHFMNRPVATVLNQPHEYIALEYRATVCRVKELIYRRGMFALDAFRLFDSDRDARVSCSELYGALTWLGLGKMHEDQVRDMMRALDKDKDGYLSLEEFKNAFGDAKRETAISRAGVRAAIDFETVAIPPRRIKELFEIPGEAAAGGNLKEAAAAAELVMTEKDVSLVRIKLKPPTDLTLAWSSKGSMADKDASIWAPETEGSMLRQNRVQICVGHYACQGLDQKGLSGSGGGLFSSMGFSRSTGAGEATTVEFKDEGKWGISGQSPLMARLVERFCPHPVRFQQVWSQQRGSPLFAWRAIPPRKEYVALGHVVTLKDEPPDVTTYRCVPRSWVVKATKAPTLVWKDAGASGGRKGSLWQINHMGMLGCCDGHDASGLSGDQWWDLKERTFHLSLSEFEAMDIAKQQQQQQQQQAAQPTSQAAAPQQATVGPPPEDPRATAPDPTRPSLDASKYKAGKAPPRYDPSEGKYPVYLVYGTPEEIAMAVNNAAAQAKADEEDPRRSGYPGWDAAAPTKPLPGRGAAPPAPSPRPPPPSGPAPATTVASNNKPSFVASASSSASAFASRVVGAVAPPPRPSKPSTAAAVRLPPAASSAATEDPLGVVGGPENAARLAVNNADTVSAVANSGLVPPPRPTKSSAALAATMLKKT